MKIIVDSRCTFNYATYYIWGLEEVFGSKNLQFDITPFKKLKYETPKELSSGLPFIIQAERDYRIFIDTQDVDIVYKDRYEWCDVYGKVNPTDSQCENLSKLMPVGPEFGIQIYSKIRTLLLGIRNFVKSRKCGSEHRTLIDYLKMYSYSFIRRRPLYQFEDPLPEKDSYIFHASTLWYNEFAWTNTNLYRGEFLKACAKAGMNIEGGLYYLGESPAILKEMPDYARYKAEYKDFIYTKRLSMDDYIRKTKKSVFVFNTPSVCECHGWKLAEYLCMGKAIISSPLTRALPGPGLVHGENVHFVSSPDELFPAVCKLKDNEAYRKKLEHGARVYYKTWVAPNAVINQICHRLGIHL